MVKLQTLDQAADALDNSVQALTSSFPCPVLVRLGKRLVHRYEQEDDLLLSYLKLVRSPARTTRRLCSCARVTRKRRMPSAG